MIFNKDDLTKEEKEQAESAYAGFKESMLKAYGHFKELRELMPEGDCREEPPDDINMYTRFEMLDDIFDSVKKDELRILSDKEIEKRFESKKEYDEWYSVDLVKDRNQIQIDYENFWFA